MKNNLINSSSPYLQQHAANPVHWQEWSPEVLKRAQDENKPLIISIGYAACHWCHVMEHESFSDEEVATYMNENFVCIKVDREERPDVDRIYMDAVQIITGQGGWPLNAFALPNGKPFFAGTYFNKARWMETMAKIIDLYKNDQQKVVDYAEQLTNGINSSSSEFGKPKDDIQFDESSYENLFEAWKSQLDHEYGGFSRAPKFPLPVAWEFLLQYNYLTKNDDALEIVEITLDEMAKGGIYDHIGGGFARYSVDAYWKVPHFEKMLYDNAQLISLYSHAYQITKKRRYKNVIEQSLGFVARELTSAEGGFYSSLNADSEGVEGKFYVFSSEEFNHIINDEFQFLLREYYQISESGNWEHGINILYAKFTKEEFAKKHDMSVDDFDSILKKANQKLFDYRAKRERPSTDDKILTSWNALMLKAYIDAYRALGDEAYLEAAIRNAEFLESNMMNDDGSLFRNHMNNKSSINAFHDDYALLSSAYLELYSITFEKKWLDLSKTLLDYCLVHFYDEKSSMFYFTSDISETLIARKHEVTDNVIPSSNSVMALSLLKLSHYSDDEKYINTSKQMYAQVSSRVETSGPWYANWGIQMGLLSHGLNEVAIMGTDALELNLEMQNNYLPNSIFLGGQKENLPLLLNKYVKDKSLIYVCKNKTCKLAVSESIEALKQIN